jgi:hypothetical protein
MQQALHFHAQHIVKRYAKCTDADHWVEAARTLRAPYWDWSKNPRPPREIYDVDSYDDDKPILRILLPNHAALSATYKDIHNPLLWYQFQNTPRWKLELEKKMQPWRARCFRHQSGLGFP